MGWAVRMLVILSVICNRIETDGRMEKCAVKVVRKRASWVCDYWTEFELLRAFMRTLMLCVLLAAESEVVFGGCYVLSPSAATSLEG